MYSQTTKHNARQKADKRMEVTLFDRVKWAFCHIKFRVSMFFFNTKSRFQRFCRGYAKTDVWNMNDWFIETVRPMLQQLLDGHAGYPGDITNTMWEEELMNMIRCLDNMVEENAAKHLGLSNVFTVEACRKINDEMDRNKDEFFRLFSKYFWNLWD